MLQDIIKQLRSYFRRLLFPIYLFPLKLITYSIYYLLRAIGRLMFALLLIISDMLVYPFLSLRNFLKTICLFALMLYMVASLLAINDYFKREYGNYKNVFCSIGINEKLRSKVVRIVGGYSEGSGFFISPTEIMTNFHVIDGETSPKIIPPKGPFLTPIKIVGDKELDIAILTVPNEYTDFVLPLPTVGTTIQDSEPIISVGYPLGTSLLGTATILKGRFIAYRDLKITQVTYLQSDINVVEGMSGGPLTDSCGNVIGINTLGLTGLSLFIDAYQAKINMPGFSDIDVKKNTLDPKKSPQEAVEAYYTYIMAHDMQSGYNLLSQEYLAYASYGEWVGRFSDILNIEVFLTEMILGAKDTVFVKFGTKSWTGSEAIYKFYEGVWVTKLEGDTYKMRRSMIKEVLDPPYDWYYSGPEF